MTSLSGASGNRTPLPTVEETERDTAQVTVHCVTVLVCIA